jgi:hypothetical protein
MLDSFMLPLSAGSLPPLAPATNASWDLGGTPVQSIFQTSSYRPPSPAFSIASFADSLTYGIGASSGLDYYVWRNMGQSSTGIDIKGEEIVKRQALALGAFTGDMLDSLVFPVQAIFYNNPLPVIKLPATMSSRWTATADRVVNFNVTIGALSLNNVPAQHKQVRQYLDSVVGWGNMRVPIPGAGASAWIPVLQVQHTEIVLDSFFLAGAPADPSLLAGIGVTQGQSSTAATTYFYRAGSYRPLSEAFHYGPDHTSAPVAFYMHTRDLPRPVGVPAVAAGNGVRIYPNPVRDGRLKIELPGGTAKEGWSYTLTTLPGQRIAGAELPFTATKRTEITLPDQLVAGIYYITIFHTNEPVSVLPLMIE